MKKIEEGELVQLMGGATGTLSSATINAFVNVIKLFVDAGSSIGSSLRRIAEGNVCPLP